jgi:nitrite reductase (NO-forming)/hydroxylamine reductase
VRELRAGAYSTDGRFYLTPADTNAVSVFDIENRRIEAEIPARVFGGSTGVAYRHAKLGPVWVTSTMVGNDLVVIGTDPEGHADTAWQILAQVPGPAAGSLFLASHPKSRHLWLDTPLASDPAFSQSVTVFDRDSLEDGSRQLPIARWSGRDEGPRRVVQPTFDNQGQEVWVLVWNPQDQGSAIVIVNDTTLKQTGVIDDNRLITPTRLYNIGELRRLGGQ